MLNEARFRMLTFMILSLGKLTHSHGRDNREDAIS